MTSIVELFPKARRLSFDLRTLLQYVERGHASPDDAAMNLEEFGRQLDVLESLVGQERPTQREDWRRCEQLLRPSLFVTAVTPRPICGIMLPPVVYSGMAGEIRGRSSLSRIKVLIVGQG